MKILQVCPRYYPSTGGVEEHVKNISERLAVTHSVTVGTTDSSGELYSEETINRVNVRRFNAWAPSEAYDFSRKLSKYLSANSEHFDIVHAHDYHSFPALYAARSKKRGKFLFTSHYHGASQNAFRSLLYKPYRLWGKKIFEKADRVICVSDFERDLILRDFKVDCEKLIVIPNGFNFAEFRNLKKRKNPENRVVLCVGRTEEYKGMQYLISVLPKLNKEVVLRIVGKGSYKENLVRLARKLNVENRVYFLQDLSRNDLLREYAEADLFALLSKYESYGISVGEALCSKTPCLVANTSALREWVDNENCFGISYPIDPADLSENMSKILGKRVKLISRKLFDWNTIVEKLVSVYQDS